MAGHSHWARIKHKKGQADARRGKLWSKLIRAVMVAAREGGGDPGHNLKLAYAIEKAKEANVPKDTIERAVKKATGELEGEQLQEALFEGYGPGGVAVLAEVLTDNRNRTLHELKKIFEQNGGSLGGPNSVAWMFQRKGLFTIPADSAPEDAVLETALEAGAEEMSRQGDVYEITCAMQDYARVRAALSSKFALASADLAYLPKTRIAVDEATGRKVMALLEALDEHDDTQNVYANYEMSAEVERAISGA